jgi:cell division protein FtsI/penicillin-binding protein 2
MEITRFKSCIGRLVLFAAMLTFLGSFAQAAVAVKHHKHIAPQAAKASVKARKTTHARTSRVASSHSRHSRTLTARGRRGRHVWAQTWDEPTYANSTDGDNVDGDDLNIRRAAVEALGPYNGSIVVVNPDNGRVMAMVNQKLALGAGFQPCSTIKLTVALAGLKENLIQQPAILKVTRRAPMDLTQAIARSNNFYFATLGTKLGYDRVAQYAHEFGYGEKAGLNIPGEQAGYFPPAPPKNGGVGMLTSFGEEIKQTPLELAALVSAIANGGKLWYLQYPRTQEEVKNFQPKLKRTLDIANLIPEIKPGMQGAVEFGTARRAKQDQPILGKTGTCSQGGTRLGWFGSYNDVGQNKLVVVVMLTGGRPSVGPMAAGVAGDVYRHLTENKVLTMGQKFTPGSLVATQICCGH